MIYTNIVFLLILIIIVSNMNAKRNMFLQVPLTAEIMTKKQRKKLKVVDYDSDTEYSEVLMVVRTEIVYEDTKAITRVEHELKWGQIYPMMVEGKVPKTGLGDLVLYEKILRSGITKIATKPKIFPCA